MNTRDKILREALTLFSSRGFDAVSVRDIARAVGIKKARFTTTLKTSRIFSIPYCASIPNVGGSISIRCG